MVFEGVPGLFAAGHLPGLPETGTVTFPAHVPGTDGSPG